MSKEITKADPPETINSTLEKLFTELKDLKHNVDVFESRIGCILSGVVDEVCEDFVELPYQMIDRINMLNSITRQINKNVQKITNRVEL